VTGFDQNKMTKSSKSFLSTKTPSTVIQSHINQQATQVS